MPYSVLNFFPMITPDPVHLVLESAQMRMRNMPMRSPIVLMSWKIFCQDPTITDQPHDVLARSHHFIFCTLDSLDLNCTDVHLVNNVLFFLFLGRLALLYKSFSSVHAHELVAWPCFKSIFYGLDKLSDCATFMLGAAPFHARHALQRLTHRLK